MQPICKRNLLDSSISVFYYCKLRVKIALWRRQNTAANVVCTAGIKGNAAGVDVASLGFMSGTPARGSVQRNRLASWIAFIGLAVVDGW